MAKAFSGIRVVDFSQVFAGPFCTHQLASLGADVIKIEEPKLGDQARSIAADNDLGRLGMSPFYLAMNANKRSMTLDLKHAKAKEILTKLIAGADVVVQNFRGGVLERLGFGYEAVRAIRPDIVYCSISGYGQDGPYASAPAYDGAIQAVSGMMAVTGHASTGPTRVGFTVVDLGTAIMAAFAVSSALYRRAITGEGQNLDVSMLDTSLALMAPLLSTYLNLGEEPQLIGNSSPAQAPTADAFPVGRGGMILMSAITDKQFASICQAIGQPGLSADPRFDTGNNRRANGAALRGILIEAFATDDATGWEKRLGALGVPASAILSVPQAVAHPQLALRNIMAKLPGEGGIERDITLFASGFMAGADSPSVVSFPPAKGQHTDEVLRELGYQAGDIAALRADGAL
jgi:crotonobetainyl-CoA:carnitine CoA-transferase CaiB-like acyl-CoA transferase